MKGLKDIKQKIVSYGMRSPYVRELGKTWDSRNKITSHDWLQLFSKWAVIGVEVLLEREG